MRLRKVTDYLKRLFSSKKEPAQTGTMLLKGKRILLVEDAPESQILISHILKKYGICVNIAENGRRALDILNGEDFDLILMDMQMPVLDGYSTTEILRRTGYKKPIISLTAHTMREDQIKCLKSGCNEVLVKPVNQLKLVDAVARYFY
jgi:CheY-like chemotaxis protein